MLLIARIGPSGKRDFSSSISGVDLPDLLLADLCTSGAAQIRLAFPATCSAQFAT